MQRTRSYMWDLGIANDSFGLIHGDLIQPNYLCYRDEVRAIDFSDFGRGYFLYDMAVTLLMLKPFDRTGRQRVAFLDGYRDVRALPPGCDELLDAFIAARAVLLARWISGAVSMSNGGRRWVAETVRWLGETN